MLRGEENKEEVENGRGDKIKHFLYYNDTSKDSVKKTGKCVINRSVLTHMSGKDNKQKGRESKFFLCTALDKIISSSIHLEMELSPQDLFELIRSIWGDHLKGNQC